MRFLPATLIALAVLAVPAVASAQEAGTDWTLTQQCSQFNGTLLPEGTFVTVWPTEFYGTTGYVIPPTATGTLLNGYPWPCGPAPLPPVPEVPVEVTEPPAAETIVQPAAIAAPTTTAPASPYVAIHNAMLDLQDALVANGGW